MPALPEFFSTETKNTLRLTRGDDKKDTGVRSRKARRGLMTRPHKTNRGTHGVPPIGFIYQAMKKSEICPYRIISIHSGVIYFTQRRKKS